MDHYRAGRPFQWREQPQPLLIAMGPDRTGVFGKQCLDVRAFIHEGRTGTLGIR